MKFLISLLTLILFIQTSLNYPIALPPSDHFFAVILFPILLPHLFYLLWSILRILKSDQLPFH